MKKSRVVLLMACITLTLLTACKAAAPTPTPTMEPTQAPTPFWQETAPPTPEPIDLPTLEPTQEDSDASIVPGEGDASSVTISRYTSTSLGFKGHAPEDWNITGGETSITFTEPAPEDIFSTRLIITIAKAPSSSMDKCLKTAYKNLDSKYSSFKLSKSKEGKLAGATSREYTFSATSDLGKLKGRMSYAIVDKKLVVVQYITTSDKYDAHQDVYRRMRDKIELTK